MESPGLDGGRLASASPTDRAPRKWRTRTGCLVCRIRKIKCDEQRPSCQRCNKANKSCVYKTPSRWAPPQTPMTSNTEVVDDQTNEISPRTMHGDAILGPTIGNYHVHDHTVILGSAPNLAEQRILSTHSEIGPDPGSSISATSNANESSPSQQASIFEPGDSLDLGDPTFDRFQQTSQLIYMSTTVDWLAASETPTPSSFSYFTELIDCPLLSPFDSLNWVRVKDHMAHLGLLHALVKECLLAVQTLYRAQVDRLPMGHANSVFQTALTSFKSCSDDMALDFDTLLIGAFLLCLCLVILPNEEGTTFSALDGSFRTRLETWLQQGHQSRVSLRLCAWLQILSTATRHPGSVGLLSEPLLGLLYDHVKEAPSLSELDRDTHPERSLYDSVATPVFKFYLELQAMSNRVVNVTHYRRSRITPADQVEVTELMLTLKDEMSFLWENRPGPLRLQPDELKEHFSNRIADPLIALAGVCLAAYHAELIVIGRILGHPTSPSLEAKHALDEIRRIVDGHWNNMADGTINPGYARPLFVYALESFDKEKSEWAAGCLRRISNPLSRSSFLASFVEAHGEAQRSQARRVTMKYFCYQTFGVPLPYM